MEKRFLPPYSMVQQLKKNMSTEKAVSICAGVIHWSLVDPHPSGLTWMLSLFGMEKNPLNDFILTLYEGRPLRDVSIIQQFSDTKEKLDDNYQMQIIEAMKEVGPIKGCGTIAGRDIDLALAEFDSIFGTMEGEKDIIKMTPYKNIFDGPAIISDRVYSPDEVKFARASDKNACDFCGELIPCCNSAQCGPTCHYCASEMYGHPSDICESYECSRIECPYSTWESIHAYHGGRDDRNIHVQKYSQSSGNLL